MTFLNKKSIAGSRIQGVGTQNIFGYYQGDHHIFKNCCNEATRNVQENYLDGNSVRMWGNNNSQEHHLFDVLFSKTKQAVLHPLVEHSVSFWVMDAH